MKRGKHLRKTLLGLVCLLLAFPSLGAAAEFTLKSGTLLRVFERDTPAGEEEKVLPAYEYLQLDIGSLASKGLSFHFYGWGRYDFADNDFYQDQEAGELLYGYLEYEQPDSSLNLRLGRQYIFEGVANESVDGLRLSSQLGQYFSASAYAGKSVGLDTTDGGSSDTIYGGRLAHFLGSTYQLGVSYKNSENNGDIAEEMLGYDLSLFLPGSIGFYGNSVRNLETKGWAEHSYELRFNLANIAFRPYYEMFQYEDYFGTGANAVNPFRLLGLTEEELDIYGLDASYQLSDATDVGFKLKNYEYDIRESAQYYSLLANWRGEDMTAVGCEFGIMDGDAAKDQYSLIRLYGYKDNVPVLVGFLTGDVVYVDYDEDIYGESSSLFLSLGAGKRFMDDALTVELSGDYSSDPYFDEDVRALVKMTYNYDRGI